MVLLGNSGHPGMISFHVIPLHKQTQAKTKVKLHCESKIHARIHDAIRS